MKLDCAICIATLAATAACTRARRRPCAGDRCAAPKPSRASPSRSPATSASTASTCSAGSRRPTASRRSRAGSTSRTRAASTRARGASNISWLHDAGVVDARREPRMGLLRRLQVRVQRRLGNRRRRSLLLLPGQLPRGRDESEHDGAVRRGIVEMGVAQVLARGQQHVRRSRFAQQLVPRPVGELSDHRRVDAERARRPPGIQGQQQRLRQRRHAELHRLEARRHVGASSGWNSARITPTPTRRTRATRSPAATSARRPAPCSSRRRSDGARPSRATSNPIREPS